MDSDHNRRSRSIAKQKVAEAAGIRATAVAVVDAHMLHTTMQSQLVFPSISEHDLLAFQFSHFADDTRPEHWFIDAETALSFRPEMHSDQLGYYDDGIKRTLTDEQIAMFRHSEVQDLLRDCRLQREEQEYQERGMIIDSPDCDQLDISPFSEVSSLENDLVDIATVQTRAVPKRQLSPSSRSENSRSTTASVKRQRKQEVPYDQRKKRDWEQYIQGEDAQHGSMTQRRLVREMDEQRDAPVEMDYGDDAPAQPAPKRAAAASGARRPPVSYDDL